MAELARPIVRGRRLQCWAVGGLPELDPGADLAALGAASLAAAGGLEPFDVVVVTRKVVSKAEGRVTQLSAVRPTPKALEVAARTGHDPRMVQVILEESRRVIRAQPGLLVTETSQGLVCANAGVDRSNVAGGEAVLRLPLDPDASAQRLRDAWLRLAGEGPLGVVVSDTFGRPFREGAVNVAIGVAGMPALSDHRGRLDPRGYLLHASTIGTADEVAGLGELVMGKLDGLPLAVVRGLSWEGGATTAAALQRDPARDAFRS
ncbi:MAG: coenzyme F420-0:L-glutamate ligase [Candidatus Dormiibacterota bacterium]